MVLSGQCLKCQHIIQCALADYRNNSPLDPISVYSHFSFNVTQTDEYSIVTQNDIHPGCAREEQVVILILLLNSNIR